jgi:hypothetical protein
MFCQLFQKFAVVGRIKYIVAIMSLVIFALDKFKCASLHKDTMTVQPLVLSRHRPLHVASDSTFI